MIKQISDTAFAFSFTVCPPILEYGDDPYSDSLGVVSHLLPTHNIDDQEAFKWIDDNHLLYDMDYDTTEKFFKLIIFTNVEDAVAFKLRWL